MDCICVVTLLCYRVCIKYATRTYSMTTSQHPSNELFLFCCLICFIHTPDHISFGHQPNFIRLYSFNFTNFTSVFICHASKRSSTFFLCSDNNFFLCSRKQCTVFRSISRIARQQCKYHICI